MQFIETKGARIPMIGFGTWQLRGAECAKLVQEALRIGYRHVDTAQAYENEAEVGDGLKAAGLPRNDVFVTTKIAHPNSPRDDLMRQAKESLGRLKLSEVDLLLPHWGSKVASPSNADIIQAFCEIKKAGLTRHIGLSNFNVSMLEEAVKVSGGQIICNQIEIHPYIDQSKVIAACKRLGVAVAAYTPIARGKIEGDPIIGGIAKNHGKTNAQVTLRWLIQLEIIVIPRTSKAERAKENFAVFDFELTPAEMKAIGGLARPDSRLVSPAWAPVWDH